MAFEGTLAAGEQSVQSWSTSAKQHYYSALPQLNNGHQISVLFFCCQKKSSKMPSLKMIAGAKKFALRARRNSIHSKEKIEKV